MQTVYHAKDNLDAHLIKNLLEQHGINSFILGEHLQSGVGELPAVGMIQVQVHDEDLQTASQVIESWEQDQPDIPPPKEGRFNSNALVSMLMSGILLGMGIMHFLHRYGYL